MFDFESEFFKNGVPIDTYRLLNKDKELNHYFRSENVGKCVKLFDDYLSLGGKITKDGWVSHYFTVRSSDPLIEVSEFICKKYDLNLKTAKHYVYYRVIGQTWNGMINEWNVIGELSKHLESVSFKKTDYLKDEKYFTDWEGYSNDRDELLFGVQVKPLTYYTMNSEYQLRSKENHRKQREKYCDLYKVPHFMVYYDGGILQNKYNLIEEISGHVNLMSTY